MVIVWILQSGLNRCKSFRHELCQLGNLTLDRRERGVRVGLLLVQAVAEVEDLARYVLLNPLLLLFLGCGQGGVFARFCGRSRIIGHLVGRAGALFGLGTWAAAGHGGEAANSEGILQPKKDSSETSAATRT